MKKGIHPDYVECTVRCSCGNTWVTRSTVPSMTIDLCDKCHPFYTGQQKLVDTGGRVQRFANKFGGAAKAQLERAAAAKAEREKKAAEAAAAKKAEREAKAAAKAKRAAEFEKKAAAEAAKAAEQAAAEATEAPAEAAETEAAAE
ncbi:50S ribosomal protein L31 [Olsenella uli]|uniref:50S ribosomal protein L31 n=1 Tax=Olsenella uli TaxID=133926 RepID=UPI0012AB63B9|nr:50S ribosomal protein L31 [Olsenella uli]